MAGDNTLIKVGAVAVAAYVAYSQGWLSFLGIGTPATTTAPSTGASSSPAVSSAPVTSPVSTSTQSAAIATSNVALRSLDSIYAAMLALATQAGTSLTGVDGWGYYLNEVPGIVAPDPMPIFGAAIPNFDRSQNFSPLEYWAIMGPALGAQLGLHGLGAYAGLGQRAWRYA